MSRTPLLLAAIDRAWEPCLRPALRAHLAHVTDVTGTRPTPGACVLVCGATADVQAVVTVPLDARRADVFVACAGPRATPEDFVTPSLAPLLAELAADYPPDELLVVWVSPEDIAVISIEVIDTGAAGDRINTSTTGGVA